MKHCIHVYVHGSNFSLVIIEWNSKDHENPLAFMLPIAV